MQYKSCRLDNKIVLFILISFFLFGFFLLYSGINKGMFTDSYVNLRMSQDIGIFFDNQSSGIYNENVFYPFLIKVFSFVFSPQKAALFINMLFLSIGGLFFYLSVKKLNDSPVSALLALVLFLTNPLVLFWSLRVMPDICFMSLICVFIFCILDKKTVWSLGTFIVMCLLRSEGVLLLPLLLRNKKLRNKKILAISLVALPVFVLFFAKSLVFNLKLAFNSISQVDIQSNLKNHIISFPYNMDISITMLFIFSLLYLLKLDKDKKRFAVIGYTFIIYFLMNVLWPFVQFRHWLPFIPAFFMILSEFFLFIEKAVSKERKLKRLWFIIIPLFIYTVYGVYTTGVDRIHDSSMAMNDVALAGEFSKGTDAVIFTNIKEILLWYLPERRMRDFQDYEWLLQEIEKLDDVLFVLSDKKFRKKINWPDILKIEKRFESGYKYVYPCFPGNGAENSWKYLEKKNSMITVGTDIYRLDKVNFLLMFAEDTFKIQDYALCAFYLKKAVKLVPGNDIKRLNNIYFMLKSTLFQQIRRTENDEKKEKLIKEALAIPVLPKLDNKIKELKD